MADFEGLFKAAAAPERTVALCLRGDLQAAYEDLERQLREASARDEASFAGGEAREFAAKIEALREDMKSSAVTFRFRALPRGRSFTLLTEHPPRDGNRTDQLLGYSEETYYTALVRETCVSVEHPDGSKVAPADLTDEAWENLFDSLSDKQFNDLVGAASAVNNRDVDVPFSHLASLISQSSEDGSKPPKRGTSRRSGSTAGSRKSSQSTSTTTPEDLPAA